MSGWKLLTGGLLPMLASGCGLLTIPYRHDVVPESMRCVAVHDATTGERIADASVSVQVHPWENWMEPLPWWGSAEPRERIPASAPADEITFLEANRRAPGLFEIPREQRWSTVTVWFPLPAVLGHFIYHTHESLILVRTPDHQPLWIGSGMAAVAQRAREVPPRGDTASEARIDFADRRLNVYLARSSGQDPLPSQPPAGE